MDLFIILDQGMIYGLLEFFKNMLLILSV